MRCLGKGSCDLVGDGEAIMLVALYIMVISISVFYKYNDRFLKHLHWDSLQCGTRSRIAKHFINLVIMNQKVYCTVNGTTYYRDFY